MWQALREELHPHGFELVTVGLDTLGADGCRAFIEAADQKHPSLIDSHHVLADLYGVINIPSSIWIDERGMIVRPAEAAPAPPTGKPRELNLELPPEMPQRMQEMLEQAGKIKNHADEYHAALRDWVAKGAESEFAMSPEKVLARSRPRNAGRALGHAHFELACQLELDGRHDLAIEHFREAHRLVPESWTFRRQAWSLEKVGDGPLSRFWQGPAPDNEEAWPYDGDWLADIKAEGAENYTEGWEP